MKKKKIFFLMRHSGYIRNYDSVIDEFAKRGYEVRLGIAKMNKMYPHERVEAFVSSIHGVSYCLLPYFVSRWDGAKKLVRRLQDYLRYLDPKYERAVKLKERAELRVPKPLKMFLHSTIKGDEKKVWRGINMLRRLEKSIPVNEEIKNFLEKEKPDIFLITPLIDFGAAQLEWLKAAKELGIRTVLCVASWDNLTNKGLIQIEPDVVIVWNEFQKEEAVKLHRISEDKVFTTGAQCYDKWFHRKPSTTKEEFCRKVGFEAGAEFILYVGSSPFIAPEEVKFVEKWIEKIRASRNDKISRLGILIRPHPQNAKQWDSVDLSHYGNVAIYPRGGANPVDEESKRDYYDSIYHCEAVVGINTSAMVESAILNKPVFTIVTPEFETTQEGTLHFHHLVKGGLLYISKDFDTHLSQLEDVLDGDGSHTERIKGFVEKFIRPHGINRDATEVFVDRVEEFITKPAPKRSPLTTDSYLLRPLMAVLSIAVMYATGMRGKALLPNVRKVSNIKKKVRHAASSIKRVARGAEGLITGAGSEEAWVLTKLKSIAGSNRPIVVGPWLSEVGFELLYWIPFVNWVVKNYGLDRERIIVISRGGAEPWYGDIHSKYVDIFDYFNEQEFKEKNTERINATGGQKHNEISEFDKEIIERAKREIGSDRFDWLHPSFMYQLFKSYWRRESPISFVEKYTHYEAIDKKHIKGVDLSLPDEYVAVKFYFSPCFPDTPENRQAVAELLHRLSNRIDVVLLSTNIDIDDHSDFADTSAGNIHLIKDSMTLRNNLTVQTRVIAGAKAFMGTYGGFSYLAPFYGVPSVAFYSQEDKFLPVHLDVAYRAFRMLKFGAFDKLTKKSYVSEDPAVTPDRRHEFTILNINNLDILDYISTGEVAYDSRLQRTGKA